MRHSFIIILFSMLATGSLHVQAQDQLAPVRDFVRMSNAYQQNTMYLKLTIESNTNIPVNITDVSVVDAEFFITKANSYLRFGQYEQLINDSQALMVNNEQQRMILYNNADQMISQARLTKGLVISDTSVNKLAQLFSGSYSKSSHHPSIILTGKEFMRGTSFPKQELKLVYDAATKIPLQVSTISRMLIPENAVPASVNTKLPDYQKRVSIDGQSFIVKEQEVIYHYHIVEYENVKVPFTIGDRLARNASGELAPVPSFENFAVTAY